MGKLPLDAPSALMNLHNSQRRFEVQDLWLRTCTILKDGRLFAGSIAVVSRECTRPLIARIFRV
jgi:hypothetical protein